VSWPLSATACAPASRSSAELLPQLSSPLRFGTAPVIAAVRQLVFAHEGTTDVSFELRFPKQPPTAA
jgi:hypothetical protein